VAFVVPGGDPLTFEAWDRRSDAVARGLALRGVEAGTRVALRFDRAHWTAFAVAAAGLLKTGGVAVPLAGHLPDLDVGRVMTACAAAGLVGPGGAADPGGAAGPAAPRPAWTVSTRDLESEGAAGGRVTLSPPSGVAELAYPFRFLRPPLAHARSEAAIVAQLDDEGAAGADVAGPLLHACPAGTEGGRWALWSPLGPVDGPVVTLPSFDPAHFCARSAEQRATRWLLDPAAALLLVESGAAAGCDLTTVRRVVLAGAPATPELVSRLAALVPRASVVVAERATKTLTPGSGPKVRAVTAPVAASQEGMVWHEQFAPGSQNLPPLVRRYRGPLDLEVLGRAITEIVRRHEPLRTTFEVRDGQPVQLVGPPASTPLPVLDLQERSGPDQDSAVAGLLADAARPFDLVAGPLFAATVVRLGPEDHLVVLRVHHSVYDDWSVGVFRRELSVLYAAFAGGGASPLDPLPAGFSEFARQGHERQHSPEGEAERSWWKDRLAGAPLCLQLPIDDPDRPAGAPQHSAAPVSLDLPPELRLHVAALARRERATVFMVVLAAFSALVSRYTGLSDLLLSAVVANRNRTELEGMIGGFTKKIVLRHDVAGDPTFNELVARTRAVLLGALSHQDLPFEAVVQGGLGQQAARVGLVPYPVVMFQGVTPRADEVVLPGLTTTGYDTSATTTRTHFMAGAEGESDAPPWGMGLYSGTFLILSLEVGETLSLVARGAFDRPSVARLLANLRAVLAEMVAHPSRPLSELAAVDTDEARLLQRWNDTDDGREAEACLDRLFADQVARGPDTVAVTDGDRAITFADLDRRASAVAGRLGALGARAGAVVGLCLPPSIECVVAVVAVWKAGAAFVGLDAADTDEHLSHVLDDASVDVVVRPAGCDREAWRRARHLLTVDGGRTPGSPPDLPPGPAVGPGAAAVVFHGSGVTAVERAVLLEHRAVASLVIGLRRAVHEPSFGPRPADARVALSAGPAEDGFLRQVVGLLDGHPLVVTGPAAARTVAALEAAEVDLVDCDAGGATALLESGLQQAMTVRAGRGRMAPAIVVGGREPLPASLCRAVERLQHARGFRLFGPPECGFAATVEAASGTVTRFTAGRTLAGVTAHVLDAGGAAVPLRATGLLHLGGTGLARGLAGPGGLHCTGRLAHLLPDGRVEVEGAAADAVDLGGFTVDRRRMETALRTFSRAGAAAVAAAPAPGDRRLVASLTGAPPALTLAGLQVELWRRLPGYCWPDAAVDSAPAGGSTGRGPAPLPPGAIAEEALLRSLWADAPGGEPGGGDNYWQRFSFLEVVARVREAGIPLTGRQVTRNRTLGTLAADMATARLGPGPA
jgi:non-ribosomal peptide synthetase component F